LIGARVIYYYFHDHVPLYALLIYGKNERADLSPEQREQASDFVRAVKSAAKRRGRPDR